MDALPQQPLSATGLLSALRDGVGDAQANAQLLDPAGGFPVADIAALRAAGALAAVVPTDFGGLGIGTEPARAGETAQILFTLGRGSLALGRLFEGHLNAVRLVMRYGGPALREAVAADARAGHLHALWVTDGRDGLGVERLGNGLVLHGEKQFCSGAFHASRAVVTAADDGETRLLWLLLGHGEVAAPLPSGLQGLRGAGTGRVDFSGTRHPATAAFGGAGDYLREPDFSTGAWRASAVTAGGLAALVEATRAELVRRGRADHPQQRERLGRLLIDAETARLWVLHVATLAEDADREPEHAIARVNLARIAIEAACLDAIPLVQRSLGLSAFQQGNPVERMCRDLATYLRQPAPDEALSDAAGYYARNPPDLAR